MGDVAARTFNLSVNGQSFKVHPNVVSMAQMDSGSKVTNMLESHALPVVRSASMSIFLDSFYNQL